MSPMHAIQILGALPRRELADARGWLFKPDYPRRIDRYIDFFGTPGPRASTPDPCGEILLEARP